MCNSLTRCVALAILGILLAAVVAAQQPPTTPSPTTPAGPPLQLPEPPATAVSPFPLSSIRSMEDIPREYPEQEKAPVQLFEELPRFGASLFTAVSMVSAGKEPAMAPSLPVSNQPVPPNYLLGPGDQLALRVWARDFEQVAQDVTVSPEGFVILPEVGRTAANGLTLEELRGQLREAYSRFFTDPSITLTVSEQRTVEVFVTGDAVRPGKYTLAGMATVLSALHAAGGPSDIGSFRRIALQRVGEGPQEIDLYDYLLTGRRDLDVVLRPGDTIFIPPISDGEVGLCGEVRRPARYELRDEVTLAAALQLAGGLKPTAYAPMLHLWRQDSHTKWRLSAVDASSPDSPDMALPLQDGDLVIVKGILHTGANTVQLMGAVKRPGYYPVTPETTLSSLLRSAEGLAWNAHMAMGVLRRMDYSRHYYVIPFDVSEQMYGENPTPILLQPKDEIEILTQDAVERAKEVRVEGAVAHPGVYPWAGQLKISQLVMLAGGLVPEAYVKRADLLRLTEDQRYEILAVDLAAALKGDEAADLEVARGDILKISTLAEAKAPSEVQVAGFVRNAGPYPRREGMKVSDALFAAGGLKPGAGPEVLLIRGRFERDSKTERLSLVGDAENYRVEPDLLLQDDDSVTVLGRGEFKTQADIVSIQGRVRTPGAYPLQRSGATGYTVYDLVQAAGGLLQEANPAGIVVYRKRDFYLGQAQSEDLTRVLSSVNREAVPSQQPTQLTGQDQMNAYANTVSMNMREVLAGPNAMAIVLPPRPVRPEDWVSAIPISGRKLMESEGAEGNLELEPGDVVSVPRLLNTVLVLGAVPRSGAVPFVAAANTRHYVNESGGFREDAASDRMVVIHPNGAAAPISMRTVPEPGDVIVVPTKHIVRTVRTESTWAQWTRSLLGFILGAIVAN